MLGLKVNHVSKRGPGNTWREMLLTQFLRNIPAIFNIPAATIEWLESFFVQCLVWTTIFLDRFYTDWSRSVYIRRGADTVYPKKYAHGFVVLCFVVVMQSFIMNSHDVFIHIHQGCFAGTGAIVRLPQRQWSKRGGYGKISQCITTTRHSKAKTVCIFLGIYCITPSIFSQILTTDTLYHACEGEIWGVCCDSNIWFNFCHCSCCYRNAVCNILEAIDTRSLASNTLTRLTIICQYWLFL